jgi:hypothetical protein
MRSLILLLLFIVMGVFVWQNLQSVTLIFFGGSMIARLPLSVWLVMFTGAGAIGSLAIQLLSNLFRPRQKPVESWRPSPSPRPQKPLEPKRQETFFRPSASDWNNPRSSLKEEADDWDIESPPTETTPIRDYRTERVREKEPIQSPEPPSVQDIINDRLQKTPPPETTGESIDYEVPQSPRNVSRTGSIYSYTYRESTQSQPPPEQVYDADFRVIVPPSQEKTTGDGKDDGEEEWV